ncbi:hypothetical protein K7432_012236 [Basidiobolus ranarum]|uniref:Uncharacterized protein n=1 Tax=Basidiobolus ranarum TaxID=34480 RepID=A0ABR2VSL3_9FUNG
MESLITLNQPLQKEELSTPERQSLLSSNEEAKKSTTLNDTESSPARSPERIPSFLLMQVDGDISVVRIHFETSNDSIILLKATLLITCLLVLVLFLYVVITQDIIPKLKHPSSFLSFINFRTVVSFVMILWFIAFCLLSHLVRLNFDVPPEGELFFADIRKELPKCNVCVLPGGEVSLLRLDKEKSELMETDVGVRNERDKEVDGWSTRAVLVPDEGTEAIELREVESTRP